jgi:minor extracellular serine protease Vpr
MGRRLAFLWLAFLVAGSLPLAAQRGLEEYALVLKDPPLVAQIASRKDLRLAASEDRLRRIEAAQDKLRGELERRGFHVVGSVHILENAVFVRASADKVDELRGFEGVRQAASLPPAKLRLDKAVQLLNAPAAWSALGGTENAGAGIKIGLLDTGIDQNHPAFQDSSLVTPPGYPKCAGADCAYTSNKVIVARSYVYMLAAGNPADPAAGSRPDDLSPRDRIGHGTGLAMIAAGRTNTAPGGTTITGVAPKAFLGNYKIFGSPGLNDYTLGSAIITALEDAYLDGMDIVSFSLGSPAIYGPLDRGAVCWPDPFTPPDPNYICDIEADAVQNAVSKGMVVVAAAGNQANQGVFWPMLNTIGSPATAPAAITVGSTNNSHVFFSSVRMPGEDVPAGLARINTFFGDGPKPPTQVTAPLRDVQSLGNDGMACSALPSGSLAGMIALIQRGVCLFSDKVNNAQAAGAVGVVLYLDDPADTLFGPQGLFETAIPAVMIENAPGTALAFFLATHDGHTATLDPSLVAADDPFVDTVTYFSSRGPSIGQNAIKPEIVAPGTFVFTATQSYDPNSDMYDPSGYNAFSGTSFPTPMVAGAAALVYQQNPGASPADIKSALVNTATVPIQDPPIGTASVTAVGGGKLNVADAILSTVTVDPATLSYGAITTWPVTPRSLTIKNIGPSPVVLTLSAPQPLTLSTTSLTVDPGSTAAVTVGLSGNRPAAGSYEGVVTITGGAVPLRVPYLYLVGDGFPDNAFALAGDGFAGIVGGTPSPNLIVIKVVDRYGVSAPYVRVIFSSTTGGRIGYADLATDVNGIAGATGLTLGPWAGEQQFIARAGGMTVPFNGVALFPPVIYARGVVNAATGEEGQGLAPNSYAAIYGSALSLTTRVFNTPYLPLALAGVSVSFDAPNVSVPGRLYFVSPGQINVQIPPELRGMNSAQMKVSIGNFSTAVYTVRLNNYSPAIFQYPYGSGLAAALDENNNVVGTNNAVEREKVVQLFVNGLGPVDQDLPAGEPAPLSPLIWTRDLPTVTIGGRLAEVRFHGLTPTSIGLYQVNVVVPRDAPTGNQSVVIIAGGVSSKPLNLPVR